MIFAIFRRVFIWVSIICGSLMLLWFVFFAWNFIPYPSNSGYGPFVCYSPNHEYYIKRYQTVFMSITDQLYADGVAVLYDKSGRELSRGETPLSSMFGPVWSDNSVGYFGGSPEWNAKLPTSPGAHPASDTGCFDEISDYIPPEIKPHPEGDRKLFIKAIEPLNETKAPYQLQFLVEDQNRIPYTQFHYVIIRADGSRQHGETDENGKSVLIESLIEESVSFFHPPAQFIERYDSPESLTKCVKTKYTVCFDPKIYTVTANTIKVEPTNSKGDF